MSAAPTDPNPITLADIEAAAERLVGQVIRTPSVPSPALSEMAGADVVLKLENQQATGSFKDRGAFNKLHSLTEVERARGVIACSAGNHAQGVAYHAKRLGIKATIVMPVGTPFTKVARTESHGADVRILGAGLDGAEVEARAIIEREGQIFVHPYDDPRIMAGQGTVGLEMLADHPDLDTLVVPIGGGGLVAGVATAAKALKPSIEIVGVQSALHPHMIRVIQGEAEPDLSKPSQSLAEGIAVKRPGRITRGVIRDKVGRLIRVDEPAIETAVNRLIETQKIVAEGAGAVGVAALLDPDQPFRGRKVGVVVCGGNIDTRMLATVLMRGMVSDGRMVRLRVEINDQPGVLGKVARLIGEAGGNIVEVHHQRFYYDVPVKLAELDIMVELKSRGHLDRIIAALDAAGFVSRILLATNMDDVG